MNSSTTLTLLITACLLGCSVEGGKSGSKGDASQADNAVDDSAQVPDQQTIADGKAPVDVSETDAQKEDLAATDASPRISDTISDTSGGADVKGPGSEPDAGRGTDAKRTLPDGLTGVAPEVAKGLAQFNSVLDQNGEPVGPERFIGPWTVMWFYPIASTGG